MTDAELYAEARRAVVCDYGHDLEECPDEHRAYLERIIASTRALDPDRAPHDDPWLWLTVLEEARELTRDDAVRAGLVGLIDRLDP